MTITIGRCVLPDPSSVSSSGDSLSLSGVFTSSAATPADRAAEAQMRELQLNGMVDNPDEDVFPLVWTVDARFDGFYFCDAVSWSYRPDGHGGMSIADYSVTLRRVSDSFSPESETQYFATVRTNEHGVASAMTVLMAHPDDVELDSSAAAWLTRQADGGDMLVARSTVSAATVGFVTNGITPATHYVGAATIEVLGADNVWYPMHGRQVQATGVAWRLSNGIVRLTPDSPATGRMSMSVFNGSSWEAGPVVSGTLSTGGATLGEARLLRSRVTSTDNVTVNLLKNSIDTVTVRATTSDDSFNISIRRGSMLVEIGGFFGAADGLRFVPDTATSDLAAPSTSVVGVVMTSDDANGNRWALMSVDDVATNNTQGGFRNDPPNQYATWAIGAVLDGGSAITYNTAADLISQFLVPSYGQTRLVKR